MAGSDLNKPKTRLLTRKKACVIECSLLRQADLRSGAAAPIIMSLFMFIF